ncbi:hypothetical protein GCM10027456_26720 [Kineosporia babensis]
MLVVLLVALAVPASAAADVNVAPQVPEVVRTRLLGVSQGQFVVLRDERTVLVGGAGQSWREAGPAKPLDTDVVPATDVRNGQLRWVEQIRGWNGAERSVLHTFDLGSGAAGELSSDEVFVAWTPQGWLGRDGGVLREHRAGGDDRVVLSGFDSEALVRAVSDGPRTLVSATWGKQPDAVRRLVLVSDRGTEVVQELPDTDGVGAAFGGLVLTPDSIAWSTHNRYVEKDRVFRRRTGLPIEEQPEASGFLSAATDDRMLTVSSYLRKWMGGPPYVVSQVSVGGQGSWGRLQFPGRMPTDDPLSDLSGPFVDGQDIYFGLGGDLVDRAGVYRVTEGRRAERVADWPARRGTFTDLALSNGLLLYTVRDPNVAGDEKTLIKARKVLRDSSGTPGDLAGLWGFDDPPGLTRPASGAPDSVAAFGTNFLLRGTSEGRSVYRRAYLPFGALYQSFVQGSASANYTSMKASGAFNLTQGRLYAPDTTQPLFFTKTRHTDLFGSRLVWATPAGAVMTRDASSENGSQRLVESGAAGPVAIWGSRYAWLDRSGTISVADLFVQGVRRIPAATEVHDLRLNEDTLSWSSGEKVYLLNLSEPQAEPEISELGHPYEIDGNLIAGVTAAGDLSVRRLPFDTGRDRPLLVETTTSPSVPGGADWMLRGSVTKPLSQARLRIRFRGKTIRTIAQRPDGLEVAFRWDGRSGSGRAARRGEYQWVLDGDSADGKLRSVEGRERVTGVVKVTASGARR